MHKFSSMCLYALHRQQLHAWVPLFSRRVALKIVVSVILLSVPATGQDPPTLRDSLEYREAYGLICDSQARARKARSLLTHDGKRNLDSLNENELKLLSRVENELGNSKNQFTISIQLWSRSPDDPEELSWVQDAITNLLFEPDGASTVLSFVESALEKKEGNLADLLIFKAQAVLASMSSNADTQKKSTAMKALIEAGSLQAPDGLIRSAIHGDSLDFIDELFVLKTKLTATERSVLKEKIAARRKDIEN